MDGVAKLLAVEGVRYTKATYWYAMDMKDWGKLATVFTDDAIFDMRGERAHATGQDLKTLPPVEQAIAAKDPAVSVGAPHIAKFIRNIVQDWITVHHGMAPIIDVTGPEFATAIWPLFDYIDDGKNALKGYGHYHDQYQKVGDRWLISHCRLTRIRADGAHPWSAQ